MKIYIWYPIGFLAGLGILSLLCCPLTMLGSQDAPAPEPFVEPMLVPSGTPSPEIFPIDEAQMTATGIISAATMTAEARQPNATITLSFNEITATAFIDSVTATARARQIGTPTPTDVARG